MEARVLHLGPFVCLSVRAHNAKTDRCENYTRGRGQSWLDPPRNWSISGQYGPQIFPFQWYITHICCPRSKVNSKFSWILILTDFFIVFNDAIQLKSALIMICVQGRNVVRLTIVFRKVDQGHGHNVWTFERNAVETSGLAQNIADSEIVSMSNAQIFTNFFLLSSRSDENSALLPLLGRRYEELAFFTTKSNF